MRGPRRGLVGPAVLLAGMLALVAGGAVPTTSAWTDDAWFRANASAGTWVVPTPATVCEALDDGGQPNPGRTCTVTLGEDTDARDDFYNIRMTVSTTEPGLIGWRVHVAFADTTEFPFVASSVVVYNPVTILGPLPADFCTTGSRTVSFQGVTADGTDTIGPGKTFTLDLEGAANAPAVSGTTVYDCSATP